MESSPPTQFERPRSVADIIGEALDIYQRFPVLFLALALGVIAPYELVVLAATGNGPLTNQTHGGASVGIVLFLVDYALVQPLISALHIHAVMQIGEGRRPLLGQVALRGLRVLPEVAAAVIAAGLGIGLGFLAFIIPGILLALRWSVVAQTAAVEHDGWLPALRRSGELTRGNYWHILGLLIVTSLLAGGVTLAASAIPLGSTTGAASVALGIVVRTVTASFTALTLALLYFDLRGRSTGVAVAPAGEEPPRQDIV
ncbi:MAG TPA: hypothetical protein VHY83_14385 [Solirubrobacteraceae bacterium]|jgi:hypothetical protein|nr:hypothetical protein [Solirubrobacteraceae bacterium]